MNDKQQLAAMGEHLAEQQPLCMAKRIEELEAQVVGLESKLLAAKRSWPDKCPITRRDFFMEIDGVPTYGGPFDSYTIPEMLGTPDQSWHDRELFVRRFDHDRGHWVDDEIIDLRVIHDGVLDDLLGDQVPEGWQLVPVTVTPEMFNASMKWDFWPIRPSNFQRLYDAMLASAPSPDNAK